MTRKTIILIISGMIALGAAYAAMQLYANQQASLAVGRFVANLTPYAQIDYQDVNIDLLRQIVHLKHVSLLPRTHVGQVSIEDIAVMDMDVSNPIPAHMHIRLTHVRLSPNDAAWQQARANLRQLQYPDTVPIDVEISYHNDWPQEKFEIRKLTIHAPNAGRLELSFGLNNIQLTPKKILMLLFAWKRVELERASLAYQDDGLIDRLIQYEAAQHGKSSLELTDFYISQIDQRLASATDPHLKHVLQAIQHLLKHSDQISVHASPSQPVAIGRIIKTPENDLPRLLGMQAFN